MLYLVGRFGTECVTNSLDNLEKVSFFDKYNLRTLEWSTQSSYSFEHFQLFPNILHFAILYFIIMIDDTSSKMF